jgi:hypothetical protein
MAQEPGGRGTGAEAGGRVMFGVVAAGRGSDGRLRATVRALHGRSGSGDP